MDDDSFVNVVASECLHSFVECSNVVGPDGALSQKFLGGLLIRSQQSLLIILICKAYAVIDAT